MSERPLTENIKEKPLSIKEYQNTGGYRALKKVMKSMRPQEVTAIVKESGLRGRGGAGFPTGVKWEIVPMDEEARPKFLIANADEMEPGTFKDRLIVEGAPHQLIEGIIISAYAVQAEFVFIFLRRAYAKASFVIKSAIEEAKEAGYLGKNILGSNFSIDLQVHNSAGRYMCGEETGLINALEGKRATPRSKPPFPQISGLWGKPTIINNAETLSNIPHIINKGPEWFKSLSKSIDGGTKLFGVSGKVKNPGLWELPMGSTFNELIMEYAGGMKDGHKLKGFLPGGASTDFLTEKHLDIKMDYDSVIKSGSRLGTGTVIVLDDKTCPVGFVHNLINFFARESCGWCSPCREGLPWIEKILFAIENGDGHIDDIEILSSLCRYLSPGNTFCALAPGAVEPLQSALKYFGDDFQKHINEKRCSWGN